MILLKLNTPLDYYLFFSYVILGVNMLLECHLFWQQTKAMLGEIKNFSRRDLVIFVALLPFAVVPARFFQTTVCILTLNILQDMNVSMEVVGLIFVVFLVLAIISYVIPKTRWKSVNLAFGLTRSDWASERRQWKQLVTYSKLYIRKCNRTQVLVFFLWILPYYIIFETRLYAFFNRIILVGASDIPGIEIIVITLLGQGFIGKYYPHLLKEHLFFGHTRLLAFFLGNPGSEGAEGATSFVLSKGLQIANFQHCINELHEEARHNLGYYQRQVDAGKMSPGSFEKKKLDLGRDFMNESLQCAEKKNTLVTSLHIVKTTKSGQTSFFNGMFKHRFPWQQGPTK